MHRNHARGLRYHLMVLDHGMLIRISDLFRPAAGLVVFACLTVVVSRANAAAQQATGTPGHELVVGTRAAPPFAMTDQSGAREGISVDLWRHPAERLHLRYRIEECSTI